MSADETVRHDALVKELREIAADLRTAASEAETDEDRQLDEAAAREIEDRLGEADNDMDVLLELLDLNAPVFCQVAESGNGIVFEPSADMIAEALASGELVRVENFDEIEKAEVTDETEFFGVFDPQDELVELYDIDGNPVWEV